ncbi:hypothetical protein [Tessaracoccus sp. OH4464_COT-324]|uniref:hypothetical protein n=1 Tax=Tessaracoccus sp. OH4464_COT-324 TaxID=2491059 RepID=UPI000F62F330|nr:hypothetical protein [Tessaracoccus sp. OH4464_COT-324]RRD47945.1 hypothetical protein EII42_01480 [Tessaracoccus sp. OH4464_COT-324]
MPTQPNDLIILSYGADVAEHERKALEASLSGWDWSLRRGFAEQSRSGTAVIILACLTLVGTGFFQRFGEMAADRVIAIVGAVRRWMRDRAGSHPVSGSFRGKPPEVVDIVDRESGLTIRLTGAEPGLAFDMLRALLKHRDEAFDMPLMWGDGEWSQEEDRD